MKNLIRCLKKKKHGMAWHGIEEMSLCMRGGIEERFLNRFWFEKLSNDNIERFDCPNGPPTNLQIGTEQESGAKIEI